MATNVQPPPWVASLRFLTLGVLMTAVIVAMWLISHLANRIEAQTQLLLVIQRDVLVNQKQVGDLLATEAKLAEAVIRMRALVDAIHAPEALHDPPDPGPETRGRAPQRR